ncbi:RNF212B isoform 6, partial [Pan troglodytes]
VWSFQKKQTDLLIAFYKHRITKLETAMQEAQQALVSQDNRSSSAESIPYREAGFGSLGQGGRGLQGRRTPRDSYN